MSAYLFNNSAAYPLITVELGIPDAASGYATWGGATWGTSLWAPATLWTDITEYVRSLSTSWARSRELNRQPANTLSLTLSNRDGRFSPGNLSGPYVVAGTSQIRPRVQVRVQATWSGSTYPVYYGFITNWQDSPVSQGKDLITTVTASDTSSALAINTLTGATVGADGDSPSARLTKILNAAQWGFGSTLDAGVVTLQVDTSTTSAQQLCTGVTDSDGGIVFSDRDGKFIFQDRNHRSTATRSTTIQITFGSTGSDKGFDEPQLSNDDTLVYNQVNITGNGLAVQTVSDGDSQALYGVRSLNINGWMKTTAEAADLASFWLNVYKNPEYRVDGIRVVPAADPSTMWPLILDAQIADRHQVKVAIPGGGTITRDVHVSGVSHSITQSDGWRVFFDYSSAAAF